MIQITSEKLRQNLLSSKSAIRLCEIPAQRANRVLYCVGITKDPLSRMIIKHVRACLMKK
jgi:hypothetical protein